jgi:predicted ArsR family transcriptional regulator
MDYTSDIALVDLLRKRGPLSVAQLAEEMQVTATAVRQRLARLLAQGDVFRQTERTSRGRPRHRYGLTEKGRRRAGANFADLAIALWQEIRSIRDPEVRRGLLQRISHRMAGLYATAIRGASLHERMESLAELFRDRRIPFDVEGSADLPLLNAGACPYPDLAEQDRTVCAMERMLFSELLGENLRLTQCRLDGHSCCTFEPAGAVALGGEGELPALRRGIAEGRIVSKRGTGGAEAPAGAASRNGEERQ